MNVVLYYNIMLRAIWQASCWPKMGGGGEEGDGLPLIIIIEGTYQKVYSLYRNSESPMKSRIHSCGYNAYSWRIHAISQYRAAISKVFIMANGLDLILLVSFGNIKDKFGPEISGFLAIFECTKTEWGQRTVWNFNPTALLYHQHGESFCSFELSVSTGCDLTVILTVHLYILWTCMLN